MLARSLGIVLRHYFATLGSPPFWSARPSTPREIRSGRTAPRKGVSCGRQGPQVLSGSPRGGRQRERLPHANRELAVVMAHAKLETTGAGRLAVFRPGDGASTLWARRLRSSRS